MPEFLKILARSSRAFVVIIALILTAIVSYLDRITGNEIIFSVFYLAPVVLVTWYLGRTPGILMALINALALLLVDLISGAAHGHFLIPYWNALVGLMFFLITALNLAALKTSLEHEAQAARLDFLTGLRNSKAFYEAAEMEIERSARYEHPLTVAYLDCDNFKVINDTLGHHAGDDLLRAVADGIKGQIRATDVAARLGGDEFVILFPETGDSAGREIIERLRENLLGAMQNKNWPVTFSIGMVTFPDPPASVDQMLLMADKMLYKAKADGKNRISESVHS